MRGEGSNVLIYSETDKGRLRLLVALIAVYLQVVVIAIKEVDCALPGATIVIIVQHDIGCRCIGDMTAR